MAQTKRRARGEDSIYYDIKLVELKVRDVDFALGSSHNHLSTRSVRLDTR